MAGREPAGLASRRERARVHLVPPCRRHGAANTAADGPGASHPGLSRGTNWVHQRAACFLWQRVPYPYANTRVPRPLHAPGGHLQGSARQSGGRPGALPFDWLTAGRWKDYAHGNRIKTMTLAVEEFLRRFLLHVLPGGFVRIRHFGFLANRGVWPSWRGVRCCSARPRRPRGPGRVGGHPPAATDGRGPHVLPGVAWAPPDYRRLPAGPLPAPPWTAHESPVACRLPPGSAPA